MCLLPLRRCGYSKAKQDPDEEKMHFHNGHSKLISAQMCVCMCVRAEGAKQSLHYMYSRGFKQRSCLHELVHSRTVGQCELVCYQYRWQYFEVKAIFFNVKDTNLLHGSHGNL